MLLVTSLSVQHSTTITITERSSYTFKCLAQMKCGFCTVLRSNYVNSRDLKCVVFLSGLSGCSMRPYICLQIAWGSTESDFKPSAERHNDWGAGEALHTGAGWWRIIRNSDIPCDNSWSLSAKWTLLLLSTQSNDIHEEWRKSLTSKRCRPLHSVDVQMIPQPQRSTKYSRK